MSEGKKNGNGELNGGQSHPIDILLVEDNEADVKITLRAFEKAKLSNNIFTVANGEEALDFVYQRGKYEGANHPRPDIILLDIMMPKMDGFEVLKRLKGDAALSYIPVAMLTSSRAEEDVLKSFKYGAVSYIPKPVDYRDFVEVVNSFNFYWQIVNKLPSKIPQH